MVESCKLYKWIYITVWCKTAFFLKTYCYFSKNSHYCLWYISEYLKRNTLNLKVTSLSALTILLRWCHWAKSFNVNDWQAFYKNMKSPNTDETKKGVLTNSSSSGMMDILTCNKHLQQNVKTNEFKLNTTL